MNEALKIWREKLSYFQLEEAKAGDAEQKFALNLRIQEVKSKIAEFETGPSLPGGKATDAVDLALISPSGLGQEKALSGLAMPQLGSPIYLVVPGQSPSQTYQPKPRLEELFEIITDPDEVPQALFRTEAMPKTKSSLVPYLVGYVQGREGVDDTKEEIGKAVSEAQGRLLIVGASGMGKTREVMEFARKRCARDWKICVALSEGDGRLGELAPLSPELADAKLLLIIDNLHSKLLPRADSSPPYAERLEAFLTSLARQVPDNLVVIATAHSESHYQRELGLDVLGTSWGSFSVYRLPEFTLPGLQQMLAGLVAQAGVAVDQSELSKLVKNSDRKPRTLFINVNLASKESATLTEANWGPNGGDLWKESFRAVKGRHPPAGQVYAALRLLADAGLPLRKGYVAALSAALAGADTTPAIDALVDKGLLGLRLGILTAFSEEQLQELLQEAKNGALTLAEHWEVVISTVKDATNPPPEWPADLMALAYGLNRHQQPERAEEIGSFAIEQTNGSARAYMARAGARFLRGNWSGSEDDLTQVLERDPSDADANFLRGVTRQMLGDFLGMQKDLDDAIKHGRSDSTVFGLRGLAQFNLGKLVEAGADFNAAMERGPYDPKLSYLRGVVRYQLADFAGAEQDLTASLNDGLDFARMMTPLQAIERGDIEEAVQRVEEPAPPASHQDDALLFGLRGISRLIQAKYTEAEDDLTRAIQDGFSACLERMGELFQATNVPGLMASKQKFSQARAQFGSDAPLHYMRGLARVELAKLPEAKADFDTALADGFANSEVYYMRGLVQGRLEKFDEAEKDLNKAIELNRKDARAFFLRGAMRYDQGNHAGAEEDFTSAMEAGQDDPLFYFWRGRARYQQAKLVEAETDFDLALENGKTDAETYAQRGAARIDQDKNAEAEQDFDLAIAQGRDDAAMFFVRGVARYHQQKFPEAEADLSLSLDKGFSDTRAYSLRGAARLSQEDWPGAERDLTTAIAAGRDDSGGYYARARARLGLEKLAEAEEDFDAAIARGMDDADTYVQRGRARLGQAKWAAAEADFAAALARDQDAAGVSFLRGVTHLAMERYSDAESDFDASIAKYPDHAASYHERGRARLVLGKMESAEQDFASAIAREPENVETYQLRGQSRYGQGNIAGAVADYDTALAKGKLDTAILSDRVGANLRLGRFDEAERDCALLTELVGDSAKTQGSLGVLQFARGDFANALTRFESATQGDDGGEWYFWLGLTQLLLGEAPAARKAYEQRLASAVPGDVRIALGDFDFWTAQWQERLASEEVRQAIAHTRGEMAKQLSG